MCLKPKVSEVTHRYELVEDILNQCTDVTQILKRAKEKEILFKYEIVRQQGFYNMFDPKARQLTGLSKDNYLFVMKNYSRLIKEHPNIKEEITKQLQYVRYTNVNKTVLLNGCQNCIDKIFNNVINNNLKLDVEDLCQNCRKLFC